jgi:hypothetical protein
VSSGRGTAVVLVVLLAGGGCRVDATLETLVEGRSGVVRARFELDGDAVDALGGDLAEGAQVADLRRAGWSVTDPRPTNRGGATVEVSKRFGRPEDLGAVVAELSGPAGPLQAFTLARSRTLGLATYRLDGVVDLQGSTATGFPNAPDLARRLQGAGIDARRLEELLASRAVDGFSLRVRVELPGEGGGQGAREVRLGHRVKIAAVSAVPTPLRPGLLGLAVVAAVAALILAIRGRRRT